jgi:hypothetical protein
VLLFDTARFKYPPHWVDLRLLFDAVNTTDPDTQKQRGFIMLSKKLSQSVKKSLPVLQSRIPKLQKVAVTQLFESYCTFKGIKFYKDSLP